MTIFKHLWPALLLFSAGMTLVGCGATIPTPPPASLPAAAGLVPFPDDRQGRAETELLLNGSADEANRGAMPDGTALMLDGTLVGSQTDYAIYRFHLTGPAAQVQVTLDEQQTTGAWLGLADFQRQRWQLSGPFTSTQTLPLVPAINLSAADNIYIAVVVPAGSTARVIQLRLLVHNAVPTAIFTAVPDQTIVPIKVRFDAHESIDPDGKIMIYELDWDGDGVFDATSNQPYFYHTYPQAGIYQALLRVSDDSGAQASATATLRCAPAPVQVRGGAVGGHGFSTLAVIGGHPALATPQYYCATTDSTAQTWKVFPTGIASDVDELDCTSLTAVNGSPAIGFTAGTAGHASLCYARSTSADGATWDSSITLDSSGNTGYFLALAVVNNKPAISYFDWASKDLCYVAAADADGALWNAPVRIDTVGNVGWYSTLAVINGKPAISYYDFTRQDLRYVQALDADGNSWGEPVTVDSPDGHYTCLVEVAGRPAITYYSFTTGRQCYVRATDIDGRVWGLPVTLDQLASGLGAEAAPSMAIVNGLPNIVYCEPTANEIRLVRASAFDGSDWAQPVVLTAGNGAASAAEVNGRLAIGYNGGQTFLATL